MPIKGKTDKLKNLQKLLQQSREAITEATSLQAYDAARKRVAYYKDLIQRIEHESKRG